MKAKYFGKALVITSDLKVEDIKRAERICPDALILRDEKENPIFKVGVSERGISIGGMGIVFNSHTATDEAQLTLVQEAPLTKDKLTDDFGLCFMRLTKVEEQFAGIYGAASRALTDAVAIVEGVA